MDNGPFPPGSKISILNLPAPANTPPFDFRKYNVTVFMTETALNARIIL